MLKEFREFILRGNVLDLAVAVIIGAAFSRIVDSLTADIITPIIGIFGGTPDFSSLSFTINGSRFGIGSFINAVIAFLIAAGVLFFFVVKPMNMALRAITHSDDEAPTTFKCPACLSEVPLGATRCPYCTSQISQETVLDA